MRGISIYDKRKEGGWLASRRVRDTGVREETSNILGYLKKMNSLLDREDKILI